MLTLINNQLKIVPLYKQVRLRVGRKARSVLEILIALEQRVPYASYDPRVHSSSLCPHVKFFHQACEHLPGILFFPSLSVQGVSPVSICNTVCIVILVHHRLAIIAGPHYQHRQDSG